MSAGEPVTVVADRPSETELRSLIAARWRRVCASQVDLWATVALTIAVLTPAAIAQPIGEDLFFVLALPLWAVSAYLVVALPLSRRGARNGQTLGMQLLRVRIVHAHGQPIAYSWREPGRLATLFLEEMLSLRLYRLIDDDWGLLMRPDAQERLDATGPLFAVRADVLRLPGVPAARSGFG